MRKLSIVFLALWLSGCADYEAHKAELRQQRMVAACESYGFKQDDPRFPECMMRVDQADQERRAALVGAYLMMQPHPVQAQPYQMPVPSTTTTNCTGLGTQVNCTSTTH